MVDKLKEPVEPLFARIPASLKRRLVASAKAQGTGIGQELTRLLEERLDSGLSAALRRKVDDIRRDQSVQRARWLENLQDFLEVQLLACVKAAQSGDVEALVKLGNDVRVARRNRRQGLTRYQSRIEAGHREALLDQAAEDQAARNRRNFVFDAGKSIEDFQLPPEERTRRNLIELLEKMPAGTKKKLALELGWNSMSRVSHILTPKGQKGHRPISRGLAKEIADILEIEVGVLSGVEPDRGIAEMIHLADKLENLSDDIKKRAPFQVKRRR
ncbi:hypothetical protein [Burkholderia stabilis]|uniref:hypothetical protein n=1 Tax=Burkholderia stabilis TaxID=95485 RepID=UPI001F4A6380|nr:hypothetical protein [Burkholderia stabilis]